MLVKKIINDWDPINLFPYAPEDEYEEEVTQIEEYIRTASLDKHNLAKEIYTMFSEKFGSDIFTESLESCTNIANKILGLPHFIGYTLSKLRTYEWVRYNMFAREDLYHHTPGFYFRFFNPGKMYNELATCIDAFQGELQWKLYLGRETRNHNYSLEPYEVYQARLTDEYKKNYNLKGILGDKYNEICEKGINDIPSLSDHIEDWFNLVNKKPIFPDRD
ncbi:DUF1871 family protein [Paenibacillus sp. FSL H8-0317]|uniref:DUF1871 family protein n=1 Tax=Paenibacillus TaxID=44249 RepID=UPI00249A264B|nr:DUF1871 family protein [Paenibacillus amylolyticus]WFA84204.1 DUF1871 family protein [Paenibacillus amylolyticus]